MEGRGQGNWSMWNDDIEIALFNKASHDKRNSPHVLTVVMVDGMLGARGAGRQSIHMLVFEFYSEFHEPIQK